MLYAVRDSSRVGSGEGRMISAMSKEVNGRGGYFCDRKGVLCAVLS